MVALYFWSVECFFANVITSETKVDVAKIITCLISNKVIFIAFTWKLAIGVVATTAFLRCLRICVRSISFFAPQGVPACGG